MSNDVLKKLGIYHEVKHLVEPKRKQQEAKNRKRRTFHDILSLRVNSRMVGEMGGGFGMPPVDQQKMQEWEENPNFVKQCLVCRSKDYMIFPINTFIDTYMPLCKNHFKDLWEFMEKHSIHSQYSMEALWLQRQKDERQFHEMTEGYFLGLLKDLFDGWKGGHLSEKRISYRLDRSPKNRRKPGPEFWLTQGLTVGYLRLWAEKVHRGNDIMDVFEFIRYFKTQNEIPPPMLITQQQISALKLDEVME